MEPPAALSPTVPVVGVAGFSDSGKTQLIEWLIPRMTAHGLRVGVIKHAHHPLSEAPDTDSARYSASGASWVHVVSSHPTLGDSAVSGDPLAEALAEMPRDLDLILVEGFKSSPIPKLWLDPRNPPPPAAAPFVLSVAVDATDEDRERAILAEAEFQWQRRRLRVGILVGGGSLRMGFPKPFLPINSTTLGLNLIQAIKDCGLHPVLIGTPPVGFDPPDIQAVSDAPDAEGPAAGLLAALRSDPDATWLILGCDFPHLGPGGVRWLLEGRHFGTWVTLPVIGGRPNPVLALWEPAALPAIERAVVDGCRGLLQIFDRIPQVDRRVPPLALEREFASANTPEEWEALTGQKVPDSL